MPVKIRTKRENVPTLPSAKPRLPIPAITGSSPRSQNIIIRAAKIMLMDIKMLLKPKQTKEELEKYSQFSNLVYGRK